MQVYTIGFNDTTAPEFFGALRRAKIKRLLDVRLKNSAHIAGFARCVHLRFFLKEICGAEYIHQPLLAPTENLFNAYKKKKIRWEEFEKKFLALMARRRIEEKLSQTLFEIPTVLLCSEPTANKCHRRLVLEYLQDKWGNLEIIHL